MNFEFSKNLQGFEPSQHVNLNIVSYHGESAMLCRCRESCDLPGVTRTINLPQLSQYTLKIDGQADNSRTFISLTDLKGRSLINEVVYLPKKRDEVEVKFYAKVTQVKLGIYMGGDSIAIPNNKFMIFRVKLNYTKKPVLRGINSEFKITRIFETVAELESEKSDPMRGNQTPMEVGEYAILRKDYAKLGENPKQDDLYILGHHGLKYVSRIGVGRPLFLGDVFREIPGKKMPIYGDPGEAQRELNQDQKNFYRPKPKDQNYSWKNSLEGDLYLYLDPSGYVRWLRYSDDRMNEVISNEVKSDEVKSDEVKSDVVKSD